MRRLVALVPVAILVMFMVAGCAKETKEDEANLSWTINAGVNEEFVIALAFDPSSGYIWLPFFDTTKLEQVGDSLYKASEKAEIAIDDTSIDATGAEYFTFKGLMTGEALLTIVYAPSWVPGNIDQTELESMAEPYGGSRAEIFTVNIE